MGQLGVLPRGLVSQPTAVKGAGQGSLGVRWASVALASKHSIAIAADGKVYCWGLNDQGQLGRGIVNQECSDPEPVCSLLPVFASAHVCLGVAFTGRVCLVWHLKTAAGGSGCSQRSSEGPSAHAATACSEPLICRMFASTQRASVSSSSLACAGALHL